MHLGFPAVFVTIFLVACATNTPSKVDVAVTPSNSEQPAVAGATKPEYDDSVPQAKPILGDSPAVTQNLKTGMKRLTALLSRSHIQAFDSQRLLSQYYFDQLIALEFSQQCLLSAEELSALRQTYRDDLALGLAKGLLDSSLSILSLADERKQQSLVYKIQQFEPEQAPVSQHAAHELSACWQQQLQDDLQWLARLGLDTESARQFVYKRYQLQLDTLEQNTDIHQFDRLAQAYVKAYSNSESYHSAEYKEQYRKVSNGTYGLGLVFDSDTKGAKVKYKRGHSNSALKVDDVIVAIEDNGRVIPLLGEELASIVSLVKGPEGSTVKVMVLKANSNELVTYTEQRIAFKREMLGYKIIKSHPKTALIHFESMPKDFAKELEAALIELQAKGVDNVLIDLRNNGGGSLTEVITLPGLFGITEPVLLVAHGKDSQLEVEAMSAKPAANPFLGKVTILLNQASAAGTEIFAAAMQDYGRAIIIGDTSFGRGTIQQYRSLSRLYDVEEVFGAVQYTIAKVYRITGEGLQNRGIRPDVELPMVRPLGDKPLDPRLKWDQIEALQGRSRALQIDIKQLQTKLKSHYDLTETLTEQQVEQLAVELALIYADLN
ncbi:S41 family peptidase [Agarivorans sp. MS3-6]